MKAIEQHFADWETGVFGFGYGTDEEHVFKALKEFFVLTPDENTTYDYAKLEGPLTPAVAWLLINALCHCDMIEYGTSPRFGWLTSTGLAMRKFVCERTVEQLEQAVQQDNDYIHCYKHHCSCADGDCRPRNPFWPVSGGRGE